MGRPVPPGSASTLTCYPPTLSTTRRIASRRSSSGRPSASIMRNQIARRGDPRSEATTEVDPLRPPAEVPWPLGPLGPGRATRSAPARRERCVSTPDTIVLIHGFWVTPRVEGSRWGHGTQAHPRALAGAPEGREPAGEGLSSTQRHSQGTTVQSGVCGFESRPPAQECVGARLPLKGCLCAKPVLSSAENYPSRTAHRNGTARQRGAPKIAPPELPGRGGGALRSEIAVKSHHVVDFPAPASAP
jgi:hypothetical protein